MNGAAAPFTAARISVPLVREFSGRERTQAGYRLAEVLERHGGHRTSHAAVVAPILDVLSGSAPRAAAPALREPLRDAELSVMRYWDCRRGPPASAERAPASHRQPEPLLA